MTEAVPRLSDRFIPWYIVLFFAVLTCVFAGFIYIAKKSYTGLVTEQAYEKGLAYNQTIEKAKQQAALGISSRLSQEDGEIFLQLRNKGGEPLQGAKVRAWFYRPAHAGIDFSAPMEEKQAGIYALAPTLPEKGLWEVRVHAETPGGSYQTARRMVFE